MEVRSSSKGGNNWSRFDNTQASNIRSFKKWCWKWFEPSMIKGSHGSSSTQRLKGCADSWYWGWKVHKDNECWRKQAHWEKNGSSWGDIDSHHISHDAEDWGLAGTGLTLVMKHKANQMGVRISKREVWYVDSEASNHTEWFSSLEKLGHSELSK